MEQATRSSFWQADEMDCMWEVLQMRVCNLLLHVKRGCVKETHKMQYTKVNTGGAMRIQF